MKIVYFDCFSGIAGDMTLGALLDLGIPFDLFKKELNNLFLSGFQIEIKRVTRNHISAQDVYINVTDTQPHRSFADIQSIIENSNLSNKIKEQSLNIFKKLAKAEGNIHHVPYKKIHFHEVGAVDSIIDIVGSIILLNYYKIEKIYASPLPLGKGFVDCAHGKLPIPAPATLELVKNIPVYQTKRQQELVTPTGAAIITTIAETFGEMPQMKINRIGYGAGKTQSTFPNLLRIYLGKLDFTKRN